VQEHSRVVLPLAPTILLKVGRQPNRPARRRRGRAARNGERKSSGHVRGQLPSPLTGMFFFFLRIFLHPGIMFVSLYIYMYVCLSHFFKRCGWGARFIYYNVINTFKRCGVCS